MSPLPPTRRRREQKRTCHSWTWNHFTRIPRTRSVKCMLCATILSQEGGTTSSMHKHLRLIHQMVGPTETETPRQVSKRKRSPPPSSLFDKMPTDRNTTIARLAAQDNIPFKTIALSPNLRTLMESYFTDPMPRSPNTVKAIVLKKADEARKILTEKLVDLQRSGGSFSICFDEASAVNSAHRYISLSLRAEAEDNTDSAGDDAYLGLIKISGTASADIIAKAVKDRLDEFRVNIGNCCYAVTDGASVMKTVARKLNLQQQLCFAHAFHLALGKVLDLSSDLNASQLSEYGHQTDEDEVQEEIAASSDDEISEVGSVLHDVASIPEEDPESLATTANGEDAASPATAVHGEDESSQQVNEFDYVTDERAFVSVKETLASLRKVLKRIKRSGPKRDKLAEHTLEQHGRRLHVLLDTKVRWYSAVIMLQRAVFIHSSINRTLEDFDETPFTKKQKADLEGILRVLLPFKDAMQCLCCSQATLVHADRIIVVLLNKLEEIKSPLSSALHRAVIHEVRKRRTWSSSLLQYLLNPSYNWSVEDILDTVRPDFSQLQNGIMEILSINPTRETYMNENSDHAGTSEQEAQSSTSSSSAKDFEDIFKVPLRTPQSPPQTEPTAEKIYKEMKNHEGGQELGPYLKNCLRRLLTVQPTSTTAEREFSIMNHVCSKSRNALSPSVLDALVVLRAVLRQGK